MRRGIATGLAVLQALAPLAPAALAAPGGGQLAAGTATIAQSGASTVITQTSSRAIINWQSFSTAANENVQFVQPNAGAAILNRVTGGDPSVLYGTMSANGRVFLLNPNGVLFGAGSTVDTGGVVASTLSLADDCFMADRYNLAQGAGPLSAVVNRGRITAHCGGSVTLVAPVVSNEGTIQATLGKVTLAAGTQAVLSPDGGLVNLPLPAGQAGDVQLPGCASAMLKAAVKQPRIVEAGDVVEEDCGRVLLKGASGLAMNSGVIETPGAPGQRAGSVLVTGAQAAVAAPGSRISANGCGAKSAGGCVKIVSAGAAVFAPGSTLEARGGDCADGGEAEISGDRDIGINGKVDLGAGANGKPGTLLIDPLDITLTNGAVGSGTCTCAGRCPVVVANGCPSVLFFGSGGVAGGTTNTETISVNALQNVCSGAIVLEARRNFTFAMGACTTHVLKPATSFTVRTQGVAGGSITAPCANQTLIETGCGTITIQSGTDPTLAAAPITLSNLTLKTTNRAISITSGTVGGALTVGPISAGTGPVTLIAPAGSILDPTAASIAADVVTLRAGAPGGAGCIGTLAQPLHLKANNITAVSHGATGNVSIVNDPNTPVVVNCVSTGVGNVVFVNNGCCGRPAGPLTVNSAFTGCGSITLTQHGTDLTVGNAIAAGGTGGVALSIATCGTSVGSGNLVTTGQISGTGAVTLAAVNAGSNVVLGGSVTAGTTLAIGTCAAPVGGSINGGGLITAATITALSATSGIGNTARVHTSAGAITLLKSATGDIAVDNSSAAATTVAKITSTTSGNISFSQSGGGSVTFAGTGVTAAAGDVKLTSANCLTLCGAAAVVTGHDVTLNAGGALKATAAGNGPITATGALTLSAVNGIGTGNALTVTAPGISAQNSGTGCVQLTTASAAATDVIALVNSGPGVANFTQTGAGTITFEDVVAGTTAALTATGAASLVLAGPVSAPGAITVTAGAGQTLTGSGLVTSGTSVALTGPSGIGTAAQPIRTAAPAIVASNATAGSTNVNNTLGTAAAFNVTAATAGAITVSQDGGGALAIGTTGLVSSAAGDVTFTVAANDLTVAANGVQSAAGLNLRTLGAGNIALTGTSTAATANLAAAGAINGAGVVTAPTTNLSAVTGIGNVTPVVVAATTTISANNTGSGNVAITSNTGGVTEAALTTAGSGSLTFTQAGALNLTGPVSAPAGTVTLSATGTLNPTAAGAGLITADTVVLTANGGLGSTNGGLTLAADVLSATNAGAGATQLTNTLSTPLTVAGVSSPGAVTLGTGGDLTAAGVIQATGAGAAATVNAGGAIALVGAGAITAGTGAGAVTTVNAGGDVTLNAAGGIGSATSRNTSVVAGGNVGLNGAGSIQGGACGGTTVVKADGNVALAGTGNIGTNAATAGQTCVIAGGSILGTAGTRIFGTPVNLIAGDGIGGTVTISTTCVGTINGGTGDVVITNTVASPAAVTVHAITVGGHSSIQYTQNYCGAGADSVTFAGPITSGNGDILLVSNAAAGQTVTTTLGGVVKTAGPGAITVLANNAGTANSLVVNCAGAVSAGGNLTYTAGSCITLTGASTAAGTATLTAGAAGGTGAINASAAGVGLVTAGAVTLVADNGIGTANAVNLATATVSAVDTGAGAVSLTDALAGPVTATALAGPAAVTFVQSGGGAVTFDSVTAAGAVTLTNSAGSIALAGPVTTAAAAAATLTSAGSINGGGLVTAGTVNLAAATGIGNAGPVDTAAATLSIANSTSGDVVVTNQQGVAVAVNNLVDTGTGSITFTQSGGGDVTFGAGAVTTGNGNITLANTAGSLAQGVAVTAGGAASTVTLSATGAVDGGANPITANRVVVNAVTGIGATNLTLAAPLISLTDTGPGVVNATSTSCAAVTVQNLSGGAGATLTFTQTGAGAVTFQNVSAPAGTVLITSNTGSLVFAGPLDATGGVATISAAAGAIDGAGRITANTLTLCAANGIGATTPLAISADTFAATNTGNANVAISSQLGHLAQGSASTATGTITLAQSGGGALAVTGARTTGGAISLSNSGADLTLAGAVCTGAGAAVSLTTLGGGDIAFNAAVNATGNTLTATSAGRILGAGPFTATTLALVAAREVGDPSGALTGAATSISAVAGDGGINLANVQPAATTVTGLTAASGNIRFQQSAGGNVTFGPVVTGAGDVALNSISSVLTVDRVTANGPNATITLNAGTSNLQGTATARVAAENVVLAARTGIGTVRPLGLDAGVVTATNQNCGAISLANVHGTATRVVTLTDGGAGGITFDQSGGGAVSFATTTSANGAIALTAHGAGLTIEGPLTAGGANPVTLTTLGSGGVCGAGAITATALAVSAAGPVALSAVNAATVSAAGAGDVVLADTSAAAVTVTALTATGTGRALFRETGAAPVSFTTVSTQDGDVQLSTASGTLTVACSVIAGGSGSARLTAGAPGNVQLNGRVTAAGHPIVIQAGGAIAGTGQLTGGSVCLTALTGIGTLAAPVTVAASTLKASNAANDIALKSLLAGPVTVTALTQTGAGNVALTHACGPLTVGPVTDLAGAITLTASAGPLTTGLITAGAGAVTLSAKNGALTAAGPIATGTGAIALTATAGDVDVSGTLTAGSGSAVTLTTLTSGNVNLSAPVTGSTITIAAAGSVEGAGLLTASSVAITAAGAIGDAPVETAASSISVASTGAGDVEIANTLSTPVTVTLLSAAAGSISFTQSGGGAVTFDTATASSGTVALTANGGDLTVAGAVTSGGVGGIAISTLASGDVNLTGTTSAPGHTIAASAAGAINGPGTMTAGLVTLTAANGIGSGTAVATAAPTVTADDTGAGGISITSTLAAPVTVTALTVAGAGNIVFDQLGGGAATFGPVRANAGGVTLLASGGLLTLQGALSAGSGGGLSIADPTGSIVLAGYASAPGAAAFVSAGGSITGAGRLTADAVNLTAVTGMGTSAQPLQISAPSVTASNTGAGSIAIDDLTPDNVTAGSLTNRGPGDVQFAERGGGAVVFGLVTASSGSVRLSDLSATPADLTLGTVVASGDADVRASDGQILSGGAGVNLTATNARLSAGRGIGTGTGLNTAVQSITAEALNGDVTIAQSGPLDILSMTATGDISVANATGDIRLGTLVAGGTVSVNAAGNIFTLDGSLTNITSHDDEVGATLIAGGVVGVSCALPIRVDVDGSVNVSAAGVISGISVSIAGTIEDGGVLNLLNNPPGLVLLNCVPAPSQETQVLNTGNPGLVFLPYGFDLASAFQTTPESHFDLSLRGLIRTRDAWNDGWIDEILWDSRPRAEHRIEYGPEEDDQLESGDAHRLAERAEDLAHHQEKLARAQAEEEAWAPEDRPARRSAPRRAAPKHAASLFPREATAELAAIAIDDGPPARPSRYARPAPAPDEEEDDAPPPRPAVRRGAAPDQRLDALRARWRERADAGPDRDSDEM